MEVEWALRMCSDQFFGCWSSSLFSCFLSLSIPSCHLVHNDPSIIRKNPKHSKAFQVSHLPDRTDVCMYVYVNKAMGLSAPTAGLAD
jgi:hypothetical protein